MGFELFRCLCFLMLCFEIFYSFSTILALDSDPWFP